MSTTKCEKLELESTSFTNIDNKRVISYEIGTWDQFRVQSL